MPYRVVSSVWFLERRAFDFFVCSRRGLLVYVVCPFFKRKIKIPWIQYFYLHEDSMSWEALGEAGDKLRFFAHSLCSEPPIVCDEFAGGKWTKWDTLDVPNTFFGD